MKEIWTRAVAGHQHRGLRSSSVTDQLKPLFAKALKPLQPPRPAGLNGFGKPGTRA